MPEDFDASDSDQPQNYAEAMALADLVWGDHPELKTVGDVKAAWAKKREEMRNAG
jgi:hypothetical protein